MIKEVDANIYFFFMQFEHIIHKVHHKIQIFFMAAFILGSTFYHIQNFLSVLVHKSIHSMDT